MKKWMSKVSNKVTDALFGEHEFPKPTQGGPYWSATVFDYAKQLENQFARKLAAKIFSDHPESYIITRQDIKKAFIEACKEMIKHLEREHA